MDALSALICLGLAVWTVGQARRARRLREWRRRWRDYPRNSSSSLW